MEKRRKQPSLIETCVFLITVLAVGLVLSKAAQVAIPFMLAFLLSLLFAPIVKWGGQHKIPPLIMVFAIMTFLISILLPLGFFLNTRVQGVIDVMPYYYNQLVDIGRSLLVQFDLPRDFWISINWYNTVGRYVSGMTGFMLHWLGSMLMTLVFLVFMLLESPYMENRLHMAFRGESGGKIFTVADKIVNQISKYLRTLAVISFVTALCVWALLAALRIDFALTWGVLAFFLNFIPTIGSIVASIPPIMVAIVQNHSVADGMNWLPAILTFLGLLTIQFTIGNIMTPKIMGDALDLSPVVILISLLFWGLIWGFSGALLSVPIAVMIKIICENIPNLRFVAMLMCSAREDHYTETFAEDSVSASREQKD